MAFATIIRERGFEASFMSELNLPSSILCGIKPLMVVVMILDDGVGAGGGYGCVWNDFLFFAFS